MSSKEEAIELMRRRQKRETHPIRRSEYSIIAVSYTHLDVYKRQHGEELLELIWTAPFDVPKRKNNFFIF